MKRENTSKIRKLTLNEVQQESFEILKAFHNYCVENNLRYQLAYGTCLGAIRHKGFIPWDDDVDVMMPRPDFDRLNELISTQSIQNYELLSLRTSSIYSSPLAKIHNPSTLAEQQYYQLDVPQFGVYIDIFVVDGIPDQVVDQQLLFKKAFSARRKWELSIKRFGYEKNYLKRFLKVLLALPFRLIGYRYWVEQYERISKTYIFNEQDYAGVVLFGEGQRKEIFKRSVFEESVLKQFRDKEFYVPASYDTYLSQMYGDYMQLPPEEQRISKHGTHFYDCPIQ
ncbi:MAG: LicD family protein [Bacteroidaceae bacterium]|nr:LicD family protein [Bacteroidaceae bacterium]